MELLIYNGQCCFVLMFFYSYITYLHDRCARLGPILAHGQLALLHVMEVAPLEPEIAAHLTADVQVQMKSGVSAPLR